MVFCCSVEEKKFLPSANSFIPVDGPIKNKVLLYSFCSADTCKSVVDVFCLFIWVSFLFLLQYVRSMLLFLVSSSDCYPILKFSFFALIRSLCGFFIYFFRFLVLCFCMESSVVGGFEIGESSGLIEPSRSSVFVASVIDRLLPTYYDHGDCVHVCSYCKAEFWWSERNIAGSRQDDPVYNQCCRKEAVVLPIPLMPPPYILGLLQNKHYMDNIRVYNSMFSMTSFGAKVDETVNRHAGPYTFKVSGQICHRIGSFCPEGSNIPRFLQLYLYDTDNEVGNRLRIFKDDGFALQADIVAGYLHFECG